VNPPFKSKSLLKSKGKKGWGTSIDPASQELVPGCAYRLQTKAGQAGLSVVLLRVDAQAEGKCQSPGKHRVARTQ